MSFSIDVPKRYFTPEGYSLGLWLLTQRRVYKGDVNGILTQVQIDKLNALGMRWESARDFMWDKFYSAAETYYKKHGNLRPPAKYVDEKGVELGSWLVRLRVYYNSGIKQKYLSSERIEALEKIGMVWDVFDYLWEENFAAAVRYHREHGDLNVPYNYVDNEGIKLGQWLNGLRSNRNGTARNYRELTEEQIARLDAIDMIWESKYEKQWNDAFQALCDYYEKNGTFDIPAAYSTESGIRLGAWVRRQRDFYEKGRISDEHIKRLRGIGFVLEKTDPWEEKFQLAKEYFEEHGHLNMPGNYIKNGVWLNKWLNEQRLTAEGKRKKKLTSEQLEKLQSIGLQVGSYLNDAIWKEHYEIAKKYYEEYGNLNVPKNYAVNDFELWVWIRNQKSNYKNGKLSSERVGLLETISMDWSSIKQKEIENSYEIGFQHLEEFINENGVTELRHNTVCEDGYKLGNWITKCKQKYKNGKLKQEYVQRFNALGISLEKRASSWEERYQEVKAYFEKHGVYYLSKGTIGESGYDLFSWISEQRRAYKKGKLSEEQMKKLDAIGYPFLKNGSGHKSEESLIRRGT